MKRGTWYVRIDFSEVNEHGVEVQRYHQTTAISETLLRGGTDESMLRMVGIAAVKNYRNLRAELERKEKDANQT